MIVSGVSIAVVCHSVCVHFVSERLVSMILHNMDLTLLVQCKNMLSVTVPTSYKKLTIFFLGADSWLSSTVS